MFAQENKDRFINREQFGSYCDITFDMYVDEGEDRTQFENEGRVETTIHYFEAGEGEPLILLHGLGQTLYTWHKNFETLADLYHVYALDLPGHGFSGKPPIGYGIEEFSAILGAFLDAQGLDVANICTFGESVAYALDFAMQNPERVGKLVHISPLISKEIKKIFTTRVLDAPLALFAAKGKCTPQQLRQVLSRCYFDQTVLTDDVVEEYLLGLEDREYRAIAKLCMLNYMDETVITHTHDVTTPILVILGGEDIVTGGKRCAFVQCSFENATALTVRNCGYLAHEEKPEKVNDALIRFLGVPQVMEDQEEEAN